MTSLGINHIKATAILTTLCLLSVFSSKIFNITNISDFYFCSFIVMFFLMLVQFKEVLSGDGYNEINNISIIFWICISFWNIGYILTMSFRLGRWFIQCLK